jgi:putative ABC transport system permease protein
VVIRTAGDPVQIARAVRRAVLQVDQTQPPADFESLEEVLSESVASSRFIMLMLIIFAGLALVLAAIGIYGLMAYSVAQRTREIGIRISLGAKPSRIVGGLVRRGMILALLGLGAGLGGALAAGQLLRNLLFGVASADALTFATVAVSILAVTLVANYLPASRATSIEPTAALREE